MKNVRGWGQKGLYGDIKHQANIQDTRHNNPFGQPKSQRQRKT